MTRPGPSSSTAISRLPRFRRQPTLDASAADLEAGIGAIAHQVDQQLFELIGIGIDGDIGSRLHHDRHARIECGNALNQRLEDDRRELRRREGARGGLMRR